MHKWKKLLYFKIESLIFVFIDEIWFKISLVNVAVFGSKYGINPKLEI